MDTSWPLTLLDVDPLPWLLESEEPYTRWTALTGILRRSGSDPTAIDARRAVLSDARVRRLIDELTATTGEEPEAPDHHDPAYPPNRLNLLADLGVRGGDDARIEAWLDGLLRRQRDDGRFDLGAPRRDRSRPQGGSRLCDTNAVVEVLLRFGRGGEEGVGRALRRMAADLDATRQGEGWRCVPQRRPLLAGRPQDVCPQITLEGLRAFSHLPEVLRPRRLLSAARTPLTVWLRRTGERPYGFGHGWQFKSVKWPPFWYDALSVLETVGRFPELWRGPAARDEDRRALVELAACLIAYNFDSEGKVAPRRTYPGFEEFSFGRKERVSPYATARCVSALAPFSDLAEEIRSVEVDALPSSIGGSGKAVPPPKRRILNRAPSDACPVPGRLPETTQADAIARILARHHIGTPMEKASVETITADVVGLRVTRTDTPYVSLLARHPAFDPEDLDKALLKRRSLVRVRGMRGSLFAVRRDFLPVVHSATGPQVIRYARNFAEHRGVTEAVYRSLSPEILALTSEEPLTTRQIGVRLRADGTVPKGGTACGRRRAVDISAVVTLMFAEGLLLQDRPRGASEPVYVPLPRELPDVRLDAVLPEDADIRLVREYLRAFGPVTERDISWWTGLGPRRTGSALEALGDEAVRVTVREDDSRSGSSRDEEPAHLIHAADLDELGVAGPTESPAVALLPANDPLIAGYAEKGRFVSEKRRPFIFARSGTITSVILVDGRIEGVWDVAGDDTGRVALHLFGEHSFRQWEAIETAARGLTAFLFGREAPSLRVKRMQPLAERPSGAAVKPLR